MVRNTGSSYIVRTDGGEQVECRVKGNFRLKGIRTTNPVAVGDGVVLRITPNDEIAFITAIDERRNYIIRKASNLSKQSHILAANIDRVLLCGHHCASGDVDHLHRPLPRVGGRSLSACPWSWCSTK